MKENIKKNIIEKYATLTEKIAKSGNQSKHFETDVEIYRSEIHIISVIGHNDDIHISEIARKFGVTKGAISKTIKKLEKKGLVEKAIDKTNNTRTLVKLTEKGLKAHYAHEKYHNEYDKDMFSYLESLNERELEILDTFLEKANQMAERHI
ncbi:MarR family winged helix-turn-helix transcriptional regulator [Maledivibacter halophilus]|uniref:DNA-binding transcriptional regulator, MarR family n=1 Tax=Maledivibacter halophilus TaxID=36842 RepID=A0A1T5LZG8_9FIRM|nr:MarR family transcriptional regulator [Maledivibacter halophilus]SKC81204.1 DNA-binding transcriptional regulator, MarR family [Maledivibacter halophilus]